MRRLLRRLAWLILRLWLVVATSFFVVAHATQTRSADIYDFSTDRVEDSRLPTFLNLHPIDLESRVDAIIERLSRPPHTLDAHELSRIGAAGFPLLIPRLTELPVDVRHRTAWALLPIAQRMAWPGASNIDSEPSALQYLIDAWGERSADFQPEMVARWVERLAVRSEPALTASVMEYDTYALPSLMAALPDVTTAGDVARARRLLSVASHATSIPWTVAPESSPQHAQSVVNHWRRWWHLHGIEYMPVKGPSRWSATLRQTKFGQWSSLVFRFRFGTTRDNQSIVHELLSKGTRSLLLVFCGTAGAVVVGLAGLYRSRTLSAASPPPLQYLVLTSIPQLAMVAVLVRSGLETSMLSACLVACVTMGLFSLGHSHRFGVEPDRSCNEPAPDMQRLRRAPNWLFAGHIWPFQLTLVIVIETAFHVDGIGRAAVTAFRCRDLHMLMAIATITTLWLLIVEFIVQLKHLSWHRRRAIVSNA
jgi:hypothetical protein